MKGSIIRWVDDRGFGFISSDDYQGDIFVHISKFKQGFRRPRIGDSVEFQVELKNGKPNAHLVSLLGVEPDRGLSQSPSVLTVILSGLIIGAICYITYSKLFTAPVYENMGFACEGKTHCSQMLSCNEAKFYLANCPNVKIDGNHDGEPCEMQLCN